MNIIVIGAPGSGKGVQCELLSTALHLTHISAGQLLRDEIARKTSAGREAHSSMKHGQYVPTPLIMKLLERRLKRTDAKKGFILDGCPRDIEQARELHNRIPLDIVIFLHVPPRIILSRLANRRQCASCGHIETSSQKKCSKCGATLARRSDDDPRIVNKRIALYKQTITPILNYYQSERILHRINGARTIERVHRDVMTAIQRARRASSR